MGDYINDIVVYLTQKQAEQANQWIIQRTKAFQKSEEINNYIYVHGDNYRNWTRNGVLLPWLNVNDLNQEVYPTTHSKSGELVPLENQYITKINEWVSYGYLKEKPEAEELKDILLKSSGSYENENWIYSLSGTNEGRKDSSSSITIDVHDRRIDDPNEPLIIPGGIIVGNPDDPDSKVTFNVLGESEIQDTLIAGKLLDSEGEKNTKEYGHQIPNEIEGKVFLSRDSVRFDGENWTDTYNLGNNDYDNGIGNGTVEATSDIVTHTKLKAEHGVIIEDAQCTGGRALEIHNDGARIKGHTYIEEEEYENVFWLKNNSELYQGKGSSWVAPENNVIGDCYFSNEDLCPSEQRDENTIDLYKGILYKLIQIDGIIPEEGFVYYTSSDPDTEYYCDSNLVLNKVGEYSEVVVYYKDENNNYYYVSGKSIDINGKIEVKAIDTGTNTISKMYPRKINQQIKQIYQLNADYSGEKPWLEDSSYSNGEYVYWDGEKFRKIPAENAKLREAKAALTIGTRNDEVVVGKNSLEVGTNNSVSGDNSAAIGTGLSNEVEDSLMIGGISSDKHALSIHNSTKETAYVTHNGSEWLNGNFDVEGASGLKGKTVIGENLNEHQLAFEVKHHSQFDEQVKIKKDDLCEKSLIVDGESQFNKDVTLGKGAPAEKQVEESVNLWVNGEIYNQRIPYEVYESITIGEEKIPNELADKFFVNSSIATATAAFRGNFSPVEYGYELYTEAPPEEYQIFLSLEETPYPYLETNEIFAIGPDEEGEYTFYQKRNFNPRDKQAVIEWLNNYNYTSYIPDETIETYFDLPSAKEHLGQIYKILETIEFYESIEIEASEGEKIYEWKKLISPPDKNDYCYFQIVDKKGVDDNVLFAEKYEDNNDILTLPNETSPYPVEIICWRFKFVEFLHPATHEPSDRRTWQFEYQLNNSGFTWEQWNAINSGISGAWMKETRKQIAQEVAIREQNDNVLQNLIEQTTTGIVIKDKMGDANHFIYLEKEENSSNGIQRYITKQCKFGLEMTVGNMSYNGNYSYPATVFTNNQNEIQYGYNNKLYLPIITGAETETLITDERVTKKLGDYVTTSNFNTTLLDYCYSDSSVGNDNVPIYLVKNNGKLIPNSCNFEISTTQDLTVNNFIAAYNEKTYMPNTNFVLPKITEQLSKPKILATENYVGYEITQALSNYATISDLEDYALQSYIDDNFITEIEADNKYALQDDVLAALSKGNIIFGTAQLTTPEGKERRAVTVFGDKQEFDDCTYLTLLSVHIDPGYGWGKNSSVSYRNFLQRFFDVDKYDYRSIIIKSGTEVVHTSTGTLGDLKNISWDSVNQVLNFEANTTSDILAVFSFTLKLTKRKNS